MGVGVFFGAARRLGEPAAAAGARRPLLRLVAAAAAITLALVVGPARLGGRGFLACRGRGALSGSGFVFVFVGAGRLGVLIGLGKESHLRKVRKS